MSESVTAILLALCVFILSYLGCMFALLTHRRKLGPIEQDLDMKLIRTEAAYALCEQHLAHASATSKKRLAKIHELQAEVAALQNHLANLGLQASQETWSPDAQP